MTVDFNNIRKQAIDRLDGLVIKLNKSILNNDQWALPNSVLHGQEINIKGHVLIDADDIANELDDLRMLIGTIAGCLEEGREDLADVYSELFPDGSKSMQMFNPQMFIP